MLVSSSVEKLSLQMDSEGEKEVRGGGVVVEGPGRGRTTEELGRKGGRERVVCQEEPTSSSHLPPPPQCYAGCPGSSPGQDPNLKSFLFSEVHPKGRYAKAFGSASRNLASTSAV